MSDLECEAWKRMQEWREGKSPGKPKQEIPSKSIYQWPGTMPSDSLQGIQEETTEINVGGGWSVFPSSQSLSL